MSKKKITHRVYENWTARRSRIHVATCNQYKKHGGGSGENSKWHSCSSYQEAKRLMNSFSYENKRHCHFCM